MILESYLHHFSSVLGQMHLFEERLDDLLVRALVVFNLLVELFANIVVFGVHALLGFPPGVRIHPVLNDAGLVAGCQINELVDVFVQVVLDPLVVLHVHGLAFQVRAVNGPLVHVHALQIVHNDGAHALHDAVGLREFQVLQRDFQGFDEIAQLDGVLAILIQKHIQIKLRVVGDVVRVVRDPVAKTRSRQSERQRAVVRHLRLNRVHQNLVLVDHVLVLRHDFLVVLHQILDNANQIRKMLVLSGGCRNNSGHRAIVRLVLRMCLFVNAQSGAKFIRFAAYVASMHRRHPNCIGRIGRIGRIGIHPLFMFGRVKMSVIITFVRTCHIAQ